MSYEDLEEELEMKCHKIKFLKEEAKSKNEIIKELISEFQNIRTKIDDVLETHGARNIFCVKRKIHNGTLSP